MIFLFANVPFFSSFFSGGVDFFFVYFVVLLVCLFVFAWVFVCLFVLTHSLVDCKGRVSFVFLRKLQGDKASVDTTPVYVSLCEEASWCSLALEENDCPWHCAINVLSLKAIQSQYCCILEIYMLFLTLQS